MGMKIGVELGTNRAVCKLCNCKIRINEYAVKINAFRSSTQVHLLCLNKMADVIDVEGD